VWAFAAKQACGAARCVHCASVASLPGMDTPREFFLSLLEENGARNVRQR
jgi:hypothetical protein